MGGFVLGRFVVVFVLGRGLGVVEPSGLRYLSHDKSSGRSEDLSVEPEILTLCDFETSRSYMKTRYRRTFTYSYL